MKSVLIISDKDEAVGTLRSAFAKKDRIAHAQNMENALEILHKRRFDLLFVDIEACLRESRQHGKAIQPFLDLYPTSADHRDGAEGQDQRCADDGKWLMLRYDLHKEEFKA